MNEDKLIELLSNFDDDLVEKEVDKLLEGVEIDMDLINKKAHQKLNSNNKKGKHKKRYPYIAVACACLLCITTAYADDISEAIKVFFNKTTIYSTIVDGDAYYLKEGYNLNDDIKIESVMVSEGNLKMELTTHLSLTELGELNIIPENNSSTVYYPGGYSQEEDEYFFLFMNKTKDDYNIKPFKDFEFVIAGNSYDVSLEKAKSLDVNNQIYTSDTTANNINGVNIGAKIIDENEKLNIQVITGFEDKDLKLARLGKPTEIKASYTTENLDEGGIISRSSNNEVDDFYVFDEMNNQYKLEIPQDSKGRPVTIFETDAPKDKRLILKLPAIIALYKKTIDSFSINIPDEGEVTLNKEIDFTIQKAVIKNIKRISPTSAEIEVELNTDGDENIDIRSFNLYSPDIKKMFAEFNGNKGIINLEFDEKLDTTNFEISYPQFVMNGDWVINMNESK